MAFFRSFEPLSACAGRDLLQLLHCVLDLVLHGSAPRVASDPPTYAPRNLRVALCDSLGFASLCFGHRERSSGKRLVAIALAKPIRV